MLSDNASATISFDLFNSFSFKLILMDKNEVSLFIRSLNICEVSDKLNLFAIAVFTSVIFALSAKLVVTSELLAFKASEVITFAVVAYELKSWSPVFIPVMAASFVFSKLV